MGDPVVQVRLAGEDAEAQVGQLLAQQLRRRRRTAPLHRRCVHLGRRISRSPLSLQESRRSRRRSRRASSRSRVPVGLDPARDRRPGTCRCSAGEPLGRDDEEEDLHRLAVGGAEVDTLRHQPDRHDAVREPVRACSAGWRCRAPIPVEPSCSRSQSCLVELVGVSSPARARRSARRGRATPRAVRRREVGEDQLRPCQRPRRTRPPLRRSACGPSTRGCSARRGTWPPSGGRSGCPRG